MKEKIAYSSVRGWAHWQLLGMVGYAMGAHAKNYLLRATCEKVLARNIERAMIVHRLIENRIEKQEIENHKINREN